MTRCAWCEVVVLTIQENTTVKTAMSTGNGSSGMSLCNGNLLTTSLEHALRNPYERAVCCVQNVTKVKCHTLSS